METGLIMSLVAVSVVFLSLTVLALFYQLSGKLFVRMDRSKGSKPEKADCASTGASDVPDEADPEEEVAAAIAMAIHEHTNIHDRESYIITIRRKN